ncbi:TAFII55 protein conserved region domain-containing protein [Sarocladium implicatum]|nr:TAFII55 protein conserved region domain-containing protein [Sarocladium implicatum]
MSGADSGAPGPQPPPPPKPRLKINVSRSSSFVTGADPASTPAKSTATPATATPSEGGRKVKLKVNASQPATPAETPITKTKAGRQPKPTQKLVDSKKRPHEDDDDDDVPLAQSAASVTTKIKIRQTPKAAPTQLVVKARGRPPVHPPGDGYDSEASDREIDPAIEEQLVLRIIEGEHCDYVRQCLENNKIGVPRAQGGADFSIKFFEEDSRRSMLVVKGQPFAGVLVDLPTITEAMKTWDKKSLMKSADVCQMLYFFQKVRNEDEARHAPLPSVIENFKWPHGLTPPMHDAVNRRFAKTISRKEIEDKEAEVERLLAEDGKASSSRWEWVDERQQDGDDEDAEGEDADGEVDDSVGYFGPQPGADDGMDVDDLEADLEAAFAEDDFAAETPYPEGATPAVITTDVTNANTPAAPQDTLESDIFGEDGDADEDEDDEDDDDDDEDMDDDERAERDQESGVKAIIASMQKTRAAKMAERERVTNNILRNRLDQQIKQLTSEIALKKSSLGIDPDDEDED